MGRNAVFGKNNELHFALQSVVSVVRKKLQSLQKTTPSVGAKTKNPQGLRHNYYTFYTYSL